MKGKQSSKLTSSPLSHWLFCFHPTLLSKRLTFECLKTHTPASVYLRCPRVSPLSPFVTPGSPLSSLHRVDLNAVTQNLLNCLPNTLFNLWQLLNECYNCFVTRWTFILWRSQLLVLCSSVDSVTALKLRRRRRVSLCFSNISFHS